jgi:metallo-beta-lactamase family protein
MHLVAVGGRQLLLDCGAKRGAWDDVRLRNGSFPFHATEVDSVVLSHAHDDHCGNLPVLVRHGFAGPIYCTEATRDLLAVMLGDSARVKEEDARVLRILDRESDGGTEPLYSREDVADVLRQCVAVALDESREILPGVHLRFAGAGHLLGAAMIHLRYQSGGRESSLTFTGDLGRRGLPLLADPAPVPAADLLVCESTYGGRTHQPMDQLRAALADVTRRTVERGGKVLIPAFSLGRTQAVVHTLRAEMMSGRAPSVPIFVDSPLAAEVADVYRRHLSRPVSNGTHGSAVFLEDSGIRYVRDADESRELHEMREPCAIVASGGMCEGGRILQHLRRHLDDPRYTVVLVSYQAPGTPGRQLLERGPTVRFHGRKWNKWADVVDLNGFSSHADHDDLLDQLTPLAGRTPQVCLVHGEPERAEALQAALTERGFREVLIPCQGQVVSF